MSGKKGMGHKKYTAEFKAQVVQQIKSGELNIRGYARESGITRCTLQRWCRESEQSKPQAVRRPGREKTRPLTTQNEYEQRIKQLEMEVDLYRSFLQAAGRK